MFGHNVTQTYPVTVLKAEKLNGKFFSTKHFFPQNIICFVENRKIFFHCKYCPTRCCVGHDISYKVPWQSPQLDFKVISNIDQFFLKKNIFLNKTFLKMFFFKTEFVDQIYYNLSI